MNRSSIDGSKLTYTVVGVLGDARQHDLTQTPDPEVLRAYQQVLPSGFVYTVLVASGTNYIVRTRGDVDLTNSIRQIFRQSAPDFAVDDFRTLRGALDEATFNQRLSLYLTGSFAGVAILMVSDGPLRRAVAVGGPKTARDRNPHGSRRISSLH